MGCFGKKRNIFHCKVIFLDDQEMIQELQHKTAGQEVLDMVFKHLNLLETAYFGLRYVDVDGQTHWLDSSKKVSKQLKGSAPFTLYFGVKFYAADPTRLMEELTRYQFFLQIKQDITHGRLPVTQELAAQLGAYAVQSELGDYDERRHNRGYISEFRFLPSQNQDLEKQVEDIHKTLKGLVPASAEWNYLEKVKWLDMYGMDLHPVLGEDNIEYFLGLAPSGIMVLRKKTKVAHYFWPRINKLYFKNKFFMIKVRDKNNDESTYGFETPSRGACKHLWKCSVEHHAFFRLTQVNTSKGDNIFKFCSKYRYSGRTEKEAQLEAKLCSRPQPEFARTPSRRHQRRIVEGATDTPSLDVSVENNNTQAVIVPKLVTSSLCDDSTVPTNTTLTPWSSSSPYVGLYTSQSPSLSLRSHSSYGGLPRSERRTSSLDNYSSHSNRKRHRHHSRENHHSDNESNSSRGGRSRRNESSNQESGSESETQSKQRRRRRHRHKSNKYQLVDSSQQWEQVQTNLIQTSHPTSPQSAVVRDLVGHRSGYANSGLESESEISLQQRKKQNRKHRSHSPLDSGSSRRIPDEVRKHLEFNLVDPSGFTEEQLKDIPFTNVHTEAKFPKFKPSLGSQMGGSVHSFESETAPSAASSQQFSTSSVLTNTHTFGSGVSQRMTAAKIVRTSGSSTMLNIPPSSISPLLPVLPSRPAINSATMGSNMAPQPLFRQEYSRPTEVDNSPTSHPNNRSELNSSKMSTGTYEWPNPFPTSASSSDRYNTSRNTPQRSEPPPHIPMATPLMAGMFLRDKADVSTPVFKTSTPYNTSRDLHSSEATDLGIPRHLPAGSGTLPRYNVRSGKPPSSGTLGKPQAHRIPPQPLPRSSLMDRSVKMGPNESSLKSNWELNSDEMATEL